MGLLDLLRGIKKTDKELRVLVLGLDNAGKTTVLKKMADEDTVQINPTQGFNMKTLVKEGIKLNVWDIGGQKAIRTYWENYYDNVDILVYVVDAADKKRLEESGTEFNNLISDAKMQGVPILVFANKQDLDNAVQPDEVAIALRLHEIPRDRAWKIQSASAKAGTGLEEGFQWALQAAKK
jgi:ADP-ribosylation factor-like protein 3